MAPIPVIEFRRTLRKFERELNIQNQSRCCCGVTLTQCHALMELDTEDRLTVNELATRLHLDKSTVSRTVDNLVRSGFVDREIPESNRRTTYISLNKNGRNVCKTINDGNNDYYSLALRSIPASKRNDFLKVFEQLTAEMMKLNDR